MIVRSAHKVNAPAGASPQKPRLFQICQIPGCARELPPRFLMCPTHWFEVPRELRAEIVDSFTAWLKGKDDVRPYLRARLRAIVHVAKLHGIDTRADEAKLARMGIEL